MSYCSNCGIEMLDTANFCPSCGKQRDEHQEIDEATVLSETDLQLDEPFAEEDPKEGRSGCLKFFMYAGAIVVALAAGSYLFMAFTPWGEEIVWEMTQEDGTHKSYSEFLAEYPNGVFASAAQAKIDKFEAEARELAKVDDQAFEAARKDTRIKAYYAYVKAYPKGRHIDEAVTGAWKSALRQDSIDAYEAYLRQFWDTEHRAEANARVVAMYKKETLKIKKQAAQQKTELIAAKANVTKRAREAAKRAKELADHLANGGKSCWKGDCWNGKGTYVYESGGYHQGNSKDSKPHGEGVRQFASGMRYVGNFKNGSYWGKGRYYYDDGSIYEGDWENDQRHGEGTYFFSDGGRYVGAFQSGEFSGRGKYSFPNGKYFDGMYAKDKGNGKGKTVHPNGNRYIGNFSNGMPNGRGKNIFADGSMYDGQFKDDKFHGFGKWFNAEGTLTYYGKYKDGVSIDEGNGSLFDDFVAATAIATGKKVAVGVAKKVFKRKKKRR